MNQLGRRTDSGREAYTAYLQQYYYLLHNRQARGHRVAPGTEELEEFLSEVVGADIDTLRRHSAPERKAEAA